MAFIYIFTHQNYISPVLNNIRPGRNMASPHHNYFFSHGRFAFAASRLFPCPYKHQKKVENDLFEAQVTSKYWDTHLSIIKSQG